MEEYSTKAVIQTLKTYSKVYFDYPYPKAVSVHARNIGMEYPMICLISEDQTKMEHTRIELNLNDKCNYP